jgi:phosphatidylinositol alpha-1,6-mannosyltransferase
LSSSNRRKNVDSLIAAVDVLGHELGVSLTVVGTGDDRARLAGIVERLGLGSTVTFLGEVSPEVLRRLYRESDLFVLAVRPDPTDVEGYGMVYVEAAASGLPVIATDTGGVADAVRDGVTGTLVRDASPAGIAEAIRRFHRHRDRYDAAAAREFAAGLTVARTSQMIADHIVAATLARTSQRGP